MENLQLIYAGTRLVASTNGVLVFKANKNWTSITGVRVSVFSPNTFSDTGFNLKKNGENLFTNELTIPVGEKEIDLTGLDLEVSESDEFRLDLTSTLGRVYAPVILELTVETSGGGAGASELNELSDVVITSPAEGNVFIFDGENWINGEAPTGGVDELDELTDVVITSPAEDDILTFDGTNWVNASLPSGGWNGGKPVSNQFSAIYFREDFLDAGDPGTGSTIMLASFSTVTAGGGTTAVPLVSESNHPGIVRITAHSSSLRVLQLAKTTAVGAIPIDSNFEINFIFRQNLDGTENYLRFGLGFNTGGNVSTPTHGCYFEKLLADTDVFAVCNNAGTSTRSSLGTLANNLWSRLRIRRVGATIGFTLNGAAEVIISTNIPTRTLDLFMVLSSSANINPKTFDIDYIDLEITGLTRY